MVKCRLCGSKAVIKLQYARMALCRNHFIEYLENRVRKTIVRYKMIKEHERVLVAVSGGKDSVSMLNILSKLHKEVGFELVALHIDLGIDDYSELSRKIVEELSITLEIPTIIVSVRELLKAGIPELARKLRRPTCSVCGVVKRYITNAVAVEIKANAIALGHNLDDLTAYVLKEFFNQNLGYISKLGPKTSNLNNLAIGRIRPLYEISEKESLVYALVLGLPFVKAECPYVRDDSMERLLKTQINELDYRFPGTKVGLMRKLAKNIETSYPPVRYNITSCRECNLISSDELCTYCKLTKRIFGRPYGSETREFIRKKINDLGINRSKGN